NSCIKYKTIDIFLIKLSIFWKVEGLIYCLLQTFIFSLFLLSVVKTNHLSLVKQTRLITFGTSVLPFSVVLYRLHHSPQRALPNRYFPLSPLFLVHQVYPATVESLDLSHLQFGYSQRLILHRELLLPIAEWMLRYMFPFVRLCLLLQQLAVLTHLYQLLYHHQLIRLPHFPLLVASSLNHP